MSINLARFFRITEIVLVVIAAGLVMTAIQTANEAVFGIQRYPSVPRPENLTPGPSGGFSLKISPGRCART